MKPRMVRLYEKSIETHNKVAEEIYQILLDQMSGSRDKSPAAIAKQAAMLLKSLEDEYNKTGNVKINRQKELIRELTFVELTEEELNDVIDKRRLRGSHYENLSYIKKHLYTERLYASPEAINKLLKRVTKKRK
jgi:hypothetical protein